LIGRSWRSFLLGKEQRYAPYKEAKKTLLLKTLDIYRLVDEKE